MLVPDASVIVYVLLDAPGAAAIERRLLHGGDPLHAPALIDVEIASALRRRARQGELDASTGLERLGVLQRFPIARHAHAHLLPRIWEHRNRLSAYDAAYVALAELLGATLVTRDAALARSTGHEARIELI
jgi:predicted nucleic acid-binding protein